MNIFTNPSSSLAPQYDDCTFFEETLPQRFELSGSSTDNCAVQGACISSLAYGPSEDCTFTVIEDGVLSINSFDISTEMLLVGEKAYFGSNGPEGVIVSAGDQIIWSSPEFLFSFGSNLGFEICIGDPCVASSSLSDDGSDGGKLYCVNGGVISGSTLSGCICTCPTGYYGDSCNTCPVGYTGTPPDDCVAISCEASSTITDWQGLDGNFYCINGGDVGGITGSCTCSNCDTGFVGTHCQGMQHFVDSMTELFNKISNQDTDEFTQATGNSIMPFGDTTVLTEGEYRCTEGTCAQTASASNRSPTMMGLVDIYGDINCVNDDASCVLDGEDARRIMWLAGTGQGKLSIRSVTFKNGKSDDSGGALGISNNPENDDSVTIVDLHLTIFLSNRATGNYDLLGNGGGGGAIYLTSPVSTLNIYGTIFTDNQGLLGADIYNAGGDVTIHETCSSPYASNIPIKGEARIL